MNKIFKAFKYAFPYTIPILFGFLFLGLSYGFLMTSMGFPAYYPLIMGIIIFAGSMQFVLVTLLSAGATLPTTAMMTLFINCRHMFYGLSFVEAFKKMGKKYRIKIVRKVTHLMRFIDRLKNYDNKKAFNDYMKRKEILWKN